MAYDLSTEKYFSRQFWNAVERVPVRLESSIQKHAGSRGAAPVGGAGGQSPPQKKNSQTQQHVCTFDDGYLLKYEFAKKMSQNNKVLE